MWQLPAKGLLIMFGMQSGLAAIRASQLAMDTISANIANANTPGYHRQVAQQVESVPWFDGQFWRGSGSEIASINRIASQAIERALTQNIAANGRVDSLLTLASQTETRINPPEGALRQRIDTLFRELGQLQARPDNRNQRAVVVQTAQGMAAEINEIDSGLNSLARSVREQTDNAVQTLNQKLAQLSALGKDITRARAQGQQPNSLLDRHQQLVNEIAEYIDIDVRPTGNGFTYNFAGGRISITQTTLKLSAEYSPDGAVTFRQAGGTFSIEPEGGILASYQQTLNSMLPDYQGRIDELATGIIGLFDHVQSTGASPAGPFVQLFGHRAAEDVNAPLSASGLPFAVREGTLHVNIYEQATGKRTLHRIDIDPDSDSMVDIAARLSAIPSLQAVVDSSTGKMTLVAQAGFRFDFSGQLPTSPELTTVTGNAPIAIRGRYEGSVNGEMRFAVEGSGQVGVTDGLSLVRLDASGGVIERFNIGKGYEPGSSLTVGDGVKLAAGSGQLNNGDAFEFEVVADADTSRLLGALGLNSFFEGSQASDIRVAGLLTGDPGRLSAGRSGDSADGSNLDRMLDLRDEKAIRGERTVERFLDDTIAGIATEVNGLQTRQSGLVSQKNGLMRERESISGVDLNEEMVSLLQHQRSYQAAMRVITTINDTLAELMNILR
jgi:flagellar hook-associated protein 1